MCRFLASLDKSSLIVVPRALSSLDSLIPRDSLALSSDWESSASSDVLSGSTDSSSLVSFGTSSLSVVLH